VIICVGDKPVNIADQPLTMPMNQCMELYVTAIACFIGLLLAASRAAMPLFARTKRAVLRISASPSIAMISIFIFAMLFYASPSFFQVPQPIVHDEFAYLLQADTFAHGRLSNPPHPMAKFFETFHVLQSPTYAAKFPPSLAMVMAGGSLIGLPILGVWISTAVGCVLIFWMLCAIVPQRWAMLVAFLSVLHPTVIWFSQVYWGGCTAMIGGVLLTGAMLRCIRSPTAPIGFIAGAGMSVLALSRPFEGVLLSIATAIALLICAYRDGRIKPLMVKFLPCALIFPLITGAWLMYYNWRVTGDPLLVPYILHSHRYMAAPLFIWQSIPPLPHYPNEQMRRFHVEVEYAEYAKQIGLKNYLIAALDRIGEIVWAYVRPLTLFIPLIVSLTFYRRRYILSSALICLGVLLTHVLLCPWMRVQYMAPLLGCFFILIALGLRRINAWRIQSKPIGRTLVRAIIFTQLILAAFVMITNAITNRQKPITERDKVIQTLTQRGGQHLVLVRYGPDHSPMTEWVYNAADIDRSPIIFARDLGPNADRPLLEYYASRQISVATVNNRSVDLESLKISATESH
jgi:hypothetical protein